MTTGPAAARVTLGVCAGAAPGGKAPLATADCAAARNFKVFSASSMKSCVATWVKANTAVVPPIAAAAAAVAATSAGGAAKRKEHAAEWSSICAAAKLDLGKANDDELCEDKVCAFRQAKGQWCKACFGGVLERPTDFATQGTLGLCAAAAKGYGAAGPTGACLAAKQHKEEAAAGMKACVEGWVDTNTQGDAAAEQATAAEKTKSTKTAAAKDQPPQELAFLEEYWDTHPHPASHEVVVPSFLETAAGAEVHAEAGSFFRRMLQKKLPNSMMDEAYLGYGHNLRIHSPMFDPSLTGDHMDNICLGRVYGCRTGEPSGDPYVSKTQFNTDFVYPGHDDALAAVRALDVSAAGTGCSSATITDMVQRFGDAAIMAYHQAHGKDIKVEMRLTDCETKTDGGYDKENPLEFVLRNMDDCAVHEYNVKQVIDGFLNMVHDYGGFLQSFKPKLIAKICKFQNKLVKKSLSDSPELRTMKMKLCNMDSLACPRNTFYAQNMGCNIRPMFGVAEVYSVANGDETMLYQVNFGERGIKITAYVGGCTAWVARVVVV